ncbi:MAG: glycosyl hydrolase [Anaerolineaceae bacterium]|nr:MAG: glycosyl hydrolase [Anaerolineaceae bacterium]
MENISDLSLLSDEQIVAKAKDLVKKMTLEEKASLCSGENMWCLKSIERLGIPQVMVTDGPHGLRKQEDSMDNLGIGESVPAVCYPTASALACSFDKDLAYEVGKALGEECLKEGVSVLLGPGANQKRSPLCGRNFEYFSEDPLLTGEIAAAMIQGVQSQGVGTSLKHFAVNNQERRRMSIDAIVDERAFRDTYLRGFEIAVKKGKPWTVMCAYNKVNGTYCSENTYLLTDILRDEWGFKGLVVSDWGATNNRVWGIKAGLDLEMPGNNGYNDKKVIAAVQDKTLAEDELDLVVERVVELILKSMQARKVDASCDMDAHHQLAIKAEREAAVLLKNVDNILPGLISQNIAVIGELAKKPRYQGAGSSKINPYRLTNAWDALVSNGLKGDYAAGYSLNKDKQEAEAETLIEEACRVSKDKDIVYIFAGLPDGYESEAFDRKEMSMPDEQNKLIEAICKVNPNVVVILSCGSPIELPWENKVKGILLAYLGGEGSGVAIADLILGKEVPSGKLAETWPISLKDNPSYNYFPGGRTTVEYRESIYVGYRYYEKAKKPVLYPFGHGLSYTSFEYSDLKLSSSECEFGEVIELSFKVKNTGELEGKETTFVFVSSQDGKVFVPVKELCAFEKITLKPGEEKDISIKLDTEQFGYYNTMIKKRYAPSGEYGIHVGSGTASLSLRDTIKLISPDMPQPDYSSSAPSYYNLSADILSIADEEFASLYGKELPAGNEPAMPPYDFNNCIMDVKHTFVGKILVRTMKKMIKKNSVGAQDDDAMIYAMIFEMPFHFLVAMSGGMLSDRMMSGLLDMMNGHFFKGVGKLLKK